MADLHCLRNLMTVRCEEPIGREASFAETSSIAVKIIFVAFVVFCVDKNGDDDCERSSHKIDGEATGSYEVA